MAKNSEKYAYLNRLSTEQLEELLRMDVEESKPVSPCCVAERLTELPFQLITQKYRAGSWSM